LKREGKENPFAVWHLLLLCIASVLPLLGVEAQLSQKPAAARGPSVQRVLLLSIDGMHSLDLAHLVKYSPDSALAKLSRHAVTYSNAYTAFPSNSWPGLLSMVTGGSPSVTGVIFENSYDRSLSPPGSDCSEVGTTIIYDSSIDKNRDAVDAGGGIDPKKLPLDPTKECSPVFPHAFIRVNTIFEVIKRSGCRTAWADKHPAYDFVNGPSGTGVDDLFTPEVRAFRGVKNVESYDDLKVAAILNQIDGKDHAGTRKVGVPVIFGMNFQAVSVAQKTSGGGYVDGSGQPSRILEEALTHTDQSIGKMVARLQESGLFDSTLLIVTAKHGDSPIDPLKLKYADLELIPEAVAAVQQGLLAGIEQDGSVALLWLSDQNRTNDVVDALRRIQEKAGIQEIYAVESLKLLLNDPKKDPRVPDTLIRFPVQTSQIAPSILKSLGLDPNSLDAVRIEKTPLLPGIDFERLSRRVAR
jgi:Type I phosphodiesterase / nucleotide pyrophosphatase